MDKVKAEFLAINLMYEHGLTDWVFEFDTAISRFGCCHRSQEKITLSLKLVELNSEEEVKDVVLHEIAHALSPKGEHHGPIWKAICVEIGCRPERCYSSKNVVTPRAVGQIKRYSYECPHCKKIIDQNYKYTNTVAACRQCCNIYNSGQYSEKFKLRLVFSK